MRSMQSIKGRLLFLAVLDKAVIANPDVRKTWHPSELWLISICNDIEGAWHALYVTTNHIYRTNSSFGTCCPLLVFAGFRCL